MSATYSINYNGSATPIETNLLADGTDSISSLDSNIKTILGSGITKSFTALTYNASYLTTTSYVALSDATINMGAPTDYALFLFIKIISAGGTGIPTLNVQFGATTASVLQGVGDFLIMPISGGVQLSTITIDSPSASTLANVQIMVGK